MNNRTRPPSQIILPISWALASISIEACSAFSLPRDSPASSPSSPPSPAAAPLVPRLTLDEYLASPIHATPVLIRDIASPRAIESLADELISTLGHEEIQMQRKTKYYDEDEFETTSSQTETDVYDVSLRDSVECIMTESSHDDSYFAFCEDLLLLPPARTSSKLSERLDRIREAPFSGTENWFDRFPPRMRPGDAIILAGEGATSTLHRDPFEWTGSSLCLEGVKIWRFVLPPGSEEGSGEGRIDDDDDDDDDGVGIVDEAFDSYRLNSIAWEEEDGKGNRDGDNDNNDKDSVVLSAGWQSDMTLYDDINDDFPTAYQWVTMEEDDPDEYRRRMEEAGTGYASCLRPSSDALDALHCVHEKKQSNDGRSNDGESDEDEDESSSPVLFVTAIQQPGDLLLIPAHCWHQTYAPVPSVAVASQRCGAEVDGVNVVNHMLEMIDGGKKKHSLAEDDVLKCEKFEEGMGKEVVARLLEFVGSG